MRALLVSFCAVYMIVYCFDVVVDVDEMCSLVSRVHPAREKWVVADFSRENVLRVVNQQVGLFSLHLQDKLLWQARETTPFPVPVLSVILGGEDLKAGASSFGALGAKERSVGFDANLSVLSAITTRWVKQDAEKPKPLLAQLATKIPGGTVRDPTKWYDALF